MPNSSLRRAFRIVQVWLLVTASRPALAQGPVPITTDRPDQTESAVTVPPGQWQLETGWSFARDRDAGLRAHAVGEALLRVGVLRRLEARLGFGGWHREHNTSVGCRLTCPPAFISSGFADLEVGAKYLMVEERRGLPQIALIAMTTIPTGEAGIGTDRADPTIRLAFSRTLSERVSLGWNGGVFSTSDVPAVDQMARRWDALYTLTVGIGLAGPVGMFVESFGTLGLSRSPDDTHSLDSGFTVQLRDNLQLDIAGGVGLNAAAEDWFVGAGVAARIPR